jgi:hypothetical protein
VCGTLVSAKGKKEASMMELYDKLFALRSCVLAGCNNVYELETAEGIMDSDAALIRQLNDKRY